MIVTHLSLARSDQQVRAETHDAHRMHMRAHHLTDGHTYTDGSRLLWAQPTRWSLVVQSSLPVSALACPAGYVDRTHSREIAFPADGDLVRWALIANPSRATRVGQPDGQRRNVAADHPDEWVTKRLSTVLDDLTIEDSARLPSVRGRRQDGSTVHLARHRWVGAGRVADAEGLAARMLGGVGHGKAYGCGLLLVVPS